MTASIVAASAWLPDHACEAGPWTTFCCDTPQDRLGASCLGRHAGRVSLLVKMLAEVVGAVVDMAGVDPAAVSIVTASGFGEVRTYAALVATCREGGAALSPLAFQHSVLNAAAGYLSMTFGNRCGATALTAGSDTAAMALLEGVTQARHHPGGVVVALGDEMRAGKLPFAAALLLRRGTAGLATITGPARGATAPPDLPGPLGGNPAAAVVPLLDALATRRSRDVPLGTGGAAGWHAGLRASAGSAIGCRGQ